MRITKRGLIRLTVLPLAAAAVLGVRTAQMTQAAQQSQRTVVNNYTRAVEELALSCEDLSSVLEKQLYAGSGKMQQSLAVELYRQAGTAKAALSQLPVAELQLQNTYKFLSQVGNYSMSLSEKLNRGESLSEEEYENIRKLYDFSKGLKDKMWDLEGEIAAGELSFQKGAAELLGGTGDPPYVTEGFTDFEGNFDSYPKLIYDGPFSDNILEREPLMTKDEKPVEEAFALNRAAGAMRVSPGELSQTAEVGGTMPGWRFSSEDGGVFCEVARDGGFISYFLNMRTVDKRSLQNSAAVAKAEEFLGYLGILSMGTTYFEVQNNVMTVNFCYLDNDRRIYPDLVKVSVAMDNGDILGYDARGFLVNHTERTYPEELCPPEKAEKALSPRLRVKKRRLAVIPTDGLNEKLCYEFTCSADSGRNVLIYINAVTAEEEDILILSETVNGILAQ
ncbi:MAG: germination protein YpeB [Ruminococcus sp.]|nr:germination protein YpeB [Ruminococcus sp.]